MQTHRKTWTSILLFALCFAGTVNAQQTPRRMPPPEALQACQKKSAAQDCEFNSPNGKVPGKCFAPEGKPLACKPTNPRAANTSNKK